MFGQVTINKLHIEWGRYMWSPQYEVVPFTEVDCPQWKTDFSSCVV